MTADPSTEPTSGPDTGTRHELRDAIHRTDVSGLLRSRVNAASGIDWALLKDVPLDKYLDEQSRASVRQLLAEVDERFGSGDDLEAVQLLRATPEWQAVVDSGWMAADGPASDVLLVLIGSDRVMEGPFLPLPGEPVSFHVNQQTDNGSNIAVLLFSGRLVWGGEGGRDYTVSGNLIARSSVRGRATVWLQYGATDESWRDSEETEVSNLSQSTREITVTGTVKPGQQLELRLGTWSHAGWKYSTRQTFAPVA
ncbi:hypothetical protein GCM10020229_69580 [Kitasatospora albolonga]|uniref:hypothetical protein n=1 Tax=Kitasatospora albolonga TaxID=68173 RepID=UPI0031EE1093